MKDPSYSHWSNALRRSVRVTRLKRYPQKLKKVIGDPRTRVGTFYDDMRTLAERFGYAGNLTSFEFRVFSQNGEDGVIAEMVRRLGDRCPRTFVEFGAGAGRSGNCVFLADALAWEGLFIEPATADFALLKQKYAYTERVRTMDEFVGPENLDDLLGRAELSSVGVMSIDVDGNDFYIWEKLKTRPAILIVEYNGSLPLDEVLVQPRGDKPWDGTNYFGSSLAALVELGKRKGYRFVHTELTGTNAFFVADEYASAFDDIVEVPARVANYELLGFVHPVDQSGRPYLTANDLLDDRRP